MASPSITLDHVSAVNRDYRRWLFLAWLALAMLVGVWAAAIVGAPWLRSAGHNGIADTIYAIFSPICHQIAARSFHFHGEPFGVCARCTGIYFGLAAGIIFYPVFRSLTNFQTPSRLWLLLSPLPTGIDFGLEFFGLWTNTHWSRFLTAALFGTVAAIYIVPGVMDLTHMIWQSRRPSPALPKVLVTGNPASAPSDYSQPDRRI